MLSKTFNVLILNYTRTSWRNGSASDSRSEGCVFESRRGHQVFIFLCVYLRLFSLFICISLVILCDAVILLTVLEEFKLAIVDTIDIQCFRTVFYFFIPLLILKLVIIQNFVLF